jgi:hypothetical protein
MRIKKTRIYHVYVTPAMYPDTINDYSGEWMMKKIKKSRYELRRINRGVIIPTGLKAGEPGDIHCQKCAWNEQMCQIEGKPWWYRQKC